MTATESGHGLIQPVSSNGYDIAAAAQMERIVADFARMYRQRNEALDTVARAHRDALMRLSRAAEYRDDDTGVHIIRIGKMAGALALLLGEPGDFAAMLEQAAPMHDIGKIGVADRVLKKPGPLTAAERTEMNRHPAIGAEILGESGVPLFELAAEVALSHHERFDGNGYPHGLACDSIPLSGRIVSVVDFFDALTMDRCYRPAFSDAQAIDMLMSERGKAFDPRIVDCFEANRKQMIDLRNRINGLGTPEGKPVGEQPRVSTATLP